MGISCTPNGFCNDWREQTKLKKLGLVLDGFGCCVMGMDVIRG